MSVAEILRELSALGSDYNRAGMARFGINTDRAYGVSVANVRKIARRYPRSHQLARDLWAVSGVNSWNLCDHCCLNLFDKTPLAWKKACR